MAQFLTNFSELVRGLNTKQTRYPGKAAKALGS